MWITITIASAVLVGLAIVFYGFAKTGCKRVKLIANWKTGLAFEIERADAFAMPDRDDDAPATGELTRGNLVASVPSHRPPQAVVAPGRAAAWRTRMGRWHAARKKS